MNIKARKLKNKKPKPSLVYYSFIQEIAKVRQFGVEKHGSSEDWRDYSDKDIYDAVLRHIFEAQKDKKVCDNESGLLSLAHAACGIMFLIEKMNGRNGVEKEDEKLLAKTMFATPETIMKMLKESKKNEKEEDPFYQQP